MSAREYDVVVAGHICLDITPKFSAEAGRDFHVLFKPGKLIEVGEATISTGGAVSNTGLSLHKLGMQTLLVSKLNHDPIGMIIENTLARHDAKLSMSMAQGEQSSYTIVINPPGVDRIFLHCPGTNDTFTSDDIDPTVLERTRHFHFGYPTLMKRFYQDEGRELRDLFKKAKDAGATTSLDMTLPDPASDSGQVDWEAILRNALPYVDIFMPSAEEALFMLMRARYAELTASSHGPAFIDRLTGDDLSQLSDRVLSLGSQMAFIKVSHRGSYLRTSAELQPAVCQDLDHWAGREIWQACYQVPRLASATGAGDSAIAGFLAAYLKGKDPVESLKYANLLGWQNVQAYDAVSGIRNWDETEKIHAADMENCTVDPQSSGWRYGVSGKIWHGPQDRF